MSIANDKPSCAEDWVKVANRELDDLRGSYHGNLSNEAKIDHAAKSVEAMLKAVFWKHEKLDKWPDRSVSRYKFLYRHNLDVLLQRCGLQTRIKGSPDHWASWQAIQNASVKMHRYLPVSPSDAEANEVARSARHPDVGIVPWLKTQFDQMT